LVRLALSSFLLLLALAFSSTAAHAEDCEFVLGFAMLRDLIGHDIVGECLENEHYNETGDSVQQTTGGLLAWRKADNRTAFTDGYRTWVNGLNGLEERLNTERFDWDSGDPPGGVIDKSPDETAPANPAPTTIADLTPEQLLAPAIEIMRSTPSGAHAFQELLRLRVGITFGGQPDLGDYLFHAPSNRIVLFGNYAHQSPDTIAQLIAEATEVAKWFHIHGSPITVEQCIERRFLAETAKEVWAAEFNNRALVSEQWRRERAHDYVYYRIHRDPTYCPGVQRESVRDPDIVRALETMQHTSIGQRVYQWFINARVSAFFDDIPYRGGVYSVGYNYIDISEAHRHTPINAAAWLVHETIHAVSLYLPRTKEECYQHEVEAFSWQAKWWLEYFGSSGSGRQDSDSRSQDFILRSFLDGRLLDAIRSTKVYQDYCATHTTD
jgi:hypothetical protein